MVVSDLNKESPTVKQLKPFFPTYRLLFASEAYTIALVIYDHNELKLT